MPRAILPPCLPWLLSLLLLAAVPPAQARTLSAKIARVSTAVATMEDVQVRLEWPPQATRGELWLHAARVDAPGLGYRYRDLAWRCPLLRAGRDQWRCEGELRAGGGRPLRLGIELAGASTDAVLSQGGSRLSLQRSAATPDLTTLQLTRVPLAWAQALAAQAWSEGRLQAGTLDGRMRVLTSPRGQLQVDGTLALAGGALETPDARIAAQDLDGRFRIGYRRRADTTLVSVDGELRGGELLYGNTYVSLPASPVAVALAAVRTGEAGWSLPSFSWRDGDALSVRGSAGFRTDGSLDELEAALHSDDIAPLGTRYLSGWLGLAGLGGLEMRGALDADVRVDDGALAALDARLHAVALRAADDRFRFDGLEGDVRYAAGAASVDSALRWRGGGLGEVDFGAGELPMRSSGGVLRLLREVSVPVLDGSVTIDGLVLRPPVAGRGLQMQGGLALDRLELGALAQALGGPAFRGTLSGRIPMARYADNRLDFDGGLEMEVFDGTVRVSALSMERPFGVAPTLSADLDLVDLDLLAITEVFDFGSITGRLHGRIHGLRLVDWSATAFDAELHTERRPGLRQRISQRAVQNISSVGDASFVSSLQGQLIGLFDDFGYRRIGISCRLVNTVCTMGGLRSAGEGFTIVEGSGIPRLTVVGFNRRVDWPTLVERLAAVGKGEVQPVFD